MFQAIVTRYIGPTNYRGSRVKATAAAGSLTIEWDHALNSKDNHAAAAKALAEKLDWPGEWHCGGLPDNSGNCYVLMGGHPAFYSYSKRKNKDHKHQWFLAPGANQESCRDCGEIRA